MSPLIRPSLPDDLPAVQAIYAHHVLTGTASFELEPPDAAELGRRRAEVLGRGLPHVVAEIDGAVVGFAYAGAYRTRPAYRTTAEDSIYMAPGFAGRGIGRALLTRVLDECAMADIRQVIAVIGGDENAGSIRLHAALGFERVGRLPAVGYKFGRWLDVVLMQHTLGAGNRLPPRDG